MLKLQTKRITFSDQNTPAPSVFCIQIFLYFSAKEGLIGFFIKLLAYVTAAIIALINQNPSKNASLETLSGRISSLQFFSKSSRIELIMSTMSSYKTFTLDFSSINVYRCMLFHCRPEYKVLRIDAEMEGKRNMNT